MRSFSNVNSNYNSADVTRRDDVGSSYDHSSSQMQIKKRNENLVISGSILKSQEVKQGAFGRYATHSQAKIGGRKKDFLLAQSKEPEHQSADYMNITELLGSRASVNSSVLMKNAAKRNQYYPGLL